MKYFKKAETVEALKAEYRKLAFDNHPDKGGDTETMQEINAEFDMAFRMLRKKAPHLFTKTDTETAADYRRGFYTKNGWAGSRFNPRLSLRDIAPIIRGYAKDVYPTWKFSVRTEHYSGGCSIYVSVMEAPSELFDDEGIRRWATEHVLKRRFKGTEEEAFAHYKADTSRGYFQNWDWYYDYMTDRARETLSDMQELVCSYRYDDSDGQIDYFSTNFYTHFNIGKWDKPLRIVPKAERIQTGKGAKGARRISA